MVANFLSRCRNELYVILCSDEVYNFAQENGVVTPGVHYENVSAPNKTCGLYISLADFKAIIF